MSIQTLKQELAILTKPEQKELLQYMIGIVAGEDPNAQSNLQAEVETRIAAYQSGKMKTYSRTEALAIVFKK